MLRKGHHAASHNNNSDGYERIARFHVSQYAYLASKLDSMKEGDGTVLDNHVSDVPFEFVDWAQA